MDVLRDGCLVNAEACGDFALGVAAEIIEGQTFVLPSGEVLGHNLPHLAHLRANEKCAFLFSSLLVAVVSGHGGRDDGLKNGGITANLFETVVKPGHFS